MPASGAPLGSTPFGFGTPATANTPPTGLPDRAIFIHSGTGDYAQDDATDQLQTMPPVRQRFLLIAKTLRGSASAVPGFGLSLPKKIDDTFEFRVKNQIRKAAAQMTDIEKVARIDDIQVKRLGSGRVSILLAYTDLTINVSDTVQEVL